MAAIAAAMDKHEPGTFRRNRRMDWTPMGTAARAVHAGRRAEILPEAEALPALRGRMARARRLVCFGGAGVSTASGIPDFRSRDGLFQREEDAPDPEMVLSKSYFYLNPQGFFDFYRTHMLYPDARPNAAHRWLYEMEKRDVLRGIVTQNIDGLHKAAGNRRVYELHGSVHENACMDCGATYPLAAILEAQGIPRCGRCGGVIKPSVVLYGEAPDKYVCIGACREISQADTLLVAGTSLSVEPAASFLDYFSGKQLIVINQTPTPADHRAELVIRGDVARVLGAMMEAE